MRKIIYPNPTIYIFKTTYPHNIRSNIKLKFSLHLLGLELLAGGNVPIHNMHAFLFQISLKYWVKFESKFWAQILYQCIVFYRCVQSQQRLISSKPLNPKQCSWPTNSFLTYYGADPVTPPPKYNPPRNTKWATVPLGGTGSSRSCSKV
jgi:hypothetical protein